MTSRPNHLSIRPITGAGELELFGQLTYVLDDELADDLASGHRRPMWMWVALRGDRLVARAAWWGRPGDATPSALDVLDVAHEADRIDVGVALLRAALAEVLPPGAAVPEYLRYIPADWREEPASRREVEDRILIAERTGAQLLVERFRFEWRPGTPIAAPSGRLAFRPIRSEPELIDLMTLVMDGTLDAHSRQDLTRMSAREGAVRHFEEELGQYRSPRDWWRVATLPDGEPVGFVTPARNDYNPIIGYLGVLPAHRGKGYVDEILAEGTRILAALDVPRIRAATDLGNIPMADAFTRAGWVNFQRAITMAWT